MNKLIVISGCSGGGKSSLLSALSDSGYYTIPEVGRQIVKEQLDIKDSITPWDNPTAFCEMIITRSVVAYHQAQAMENSLEIPKISVQKRLQFVISTISLK